VGGEEQGLVVGCTRRNDPGLIPRKKKGVVAATPKLTFSSHRRVLMAHIAYKQERFYELTEAVSTLSFNQPFFACLIFDKLVIVVTTDIDTLAVDGRRLYINKEYFLSLNPDQRVFALAHEVLHAMFMHPSRMKQYALTGLCGRSFMPNVFNIAADLVINRALIESKIGEFKQGWLFDERVESGERVEHVYERLLPPEQPCSGGGSSGDGDEEDDNDGDSGNGDSGDGDQEPDDSGGAGSEDDDADQPFRLDGTGEELRSSQTVDKHIEEASDAEHSEVEWKAAAAAASISAKSMGKMPGSLEQLVEDFLRPKRNWYEILADFIRSKSGFDQRNWRRPNKRRMYQQRLYIPTRHSWVIEKVLIIYDASGSVNQQEFATFIGVTTEIFEQCRPGEIRCLCVDTRVSSDETFTDLGEYANYTRKGGGGTDMEEGIKYIVEEGYDPDCCLILTDGYTDTHAQYEPPFPVLWVTTGAEEFAYGQVVKMEVPDGHAV
jgi:predicted metal-dependent peptidase